MTSLKSQSPRPRKHSHQPGYPTKLALGATVFAFAAACGGAVESGADQNSNGLLGEVEAGESPSEPKPNSGTGGTLGEGDDYGHGGGGGTSGWDEEPEACDTEPDLVGTGGTGGTAGYGGDLGAAGGGAGSGGWDDDYPEDPGGHGAAGSGASGSGASGGTSGETDGDCADDENPDGCADAP